MKKIIFLLICILHVFIQSSEQNIIRNNVEINGKVHEIVLTQHLGLFEIFLSKISVVELFFKKLNEDEYRIDSIVTNESFRKQGYAKYLMKYVCNYFINCGAKKIKITVSPLETEICDPEYIKTKLMLYKFYTELGFIEDEDDIEDEKDLVLKINSTKEEISHE